MHEQGIPLIMARSGRISLSLPFFTTATAIVIIIMLSAHNSAGQGGNWGVISLTKVIKVLNRS